MNKILNFLKHIRVNKVYTFVLRIFWGGPTSNKSQVITSKQHFDMTNSSVNKMLTLLFSEWITIIDSETRTSTARKASYMIKKT